jgi:uncharacterized protein (TIGR02145 family)
MKSNFVFVTMLTLSTIIAFGQRPTMELTFSAIDSADWVQLDSIKVMNRTQGGDTVLYYPDTLLVVDFQVGLPEASLDNTGFQVFQNYPNPVKDYTIISLFVPEKDKVSIIATDILGRVIVQAERTLETGTHSFSFLPGSGNLYFLTASCQKGIRSIKILNLSTGVNACSLDYLGSEPSERNLKVSEVAKEFLFSPGDELLYIGYSDSLESGILDSPEESQVYTFQFATNIPCPLTPTVTYEGQVYNTIQIFSQCWLKENLNVGTMIQGSENMTDNGIIEKYCYDNETDSCTKYGGLYQWDEMMQYTTQQSSQGICPSGWHLPTDEEWKVLEGAVDSQYDIGDIQWDDIGWRGLDVGRNLKSTNGWVNNGNGVDLFGFTGLPGGGRINYSSYFFDIGISGLWWASTESDISSGWSRYLVDYGPEAIRDGSSNYSHKEYGFSVRCLRD